MPRQVEVTITPRTVNGKVLPHHIPEVVALNVANGDQLFVYAAGSDVWLNLGPIDGDPRDNPFKVEPASALEGNLVFIRRGARVRLTALSQSADQEPYRLHHRSSLEDPRGTGAKGSNPEPGIQISHPDIIFDP